MNRLMLLVVTCFTPMFAAADPAQTANELGLMKGFPPAEDRRIALGHMLQPPSTRWTLQHLREFVPTRNVATGSQVTALKNRPKDLSGLKVSFAGGRSLSVGEWLESAYTDGFVVLQGGDVVFERYYNGQLPSTQHLMFSVTKSFTGTMMLMLMEQGLVDGTKLVSHYVPELGKSAFGDATVAQMLDMTNSINYVEDYADPKAHIAGFLQAMMPGGEGLYANLSSLTDRDERF